MGWMIRGSNPGREKRFFSLPKHPDGLWGQPSVLLKGYHGFAAGEKRLRHDVDLIHSPSAEVNNE
jgi:hypothetical protein